MNLLLCKVLYVGYGEPSLSPESLSIVSGCVKYFFKCPSLRRVETETARAVIGPSGKSTPGGYAAMASNTERIALVNVDSCVMFFPSVRL